AAIAAFYHEPRLFGVANIVAIAFLVNAAGVQHSALLQREMRFPVLAAIDIVCLVIGAAIAIGMVAAGYGYWALVAMAVSAPVVTTTAGWPATQWGPRLPRPAGAL